jgi:hypothetical protein
MAWWPAATVHADVSGFQTSGISQLNSDIFLKHLYFLSATSDKEFSPKQINFVGVDDNMARNDESPHSKHEEN